MLYFGGRVGAWAKNLKLNKYFQANCQLGFGFSIYSNIYLDQNVDIVQKSWTDKADSIRSQMFQLDIYPMKIS